jgi:uncharacterized membrane protein YdfJ with MMPL/SSD domain
MHTPRWRGSRRKARNQPVHGRRGKQVSADARTAYATVVVTSAGHEAAAQELAKAAATSHLDVKVRGAAFTKVNPGGVSEIVGILAALVILLLVFRSAWAAVLPIITGDGRCRRVQPLGRPALARHNAAQRRPELVL